MHDVVLSYAALSNTITTTTWCGTPGCWSPSSGRAGGGPGGCGWHPAGGGPGGYTGPLSCGTCTLTSDNYSNLYSIVLTWTWPPPRRSRHQDSRDLAGAEAGVSQQERSHQHPQPLEDSTHRADQPWPGGTSAALVTSLRLDRYCKYLDVSLRLNI